MSELFKNYKVALLDSSFFLLPFTDELKQGLSEIKVYVSDTFNTEIEQFHEIITDERKAFYLDNLSFIKGNITLFSNNLDSFGKDADKYSNDTWGLINFLNNLGGKFIIITSNQLLIQRIIVNRLNADIYDLIRNEIISSDDYPSLSARYDFDNHDIIAGPDSEQTPGSSSRLYLSNGSFITLGKEIKSGMEATLYHIEERPGKVAKIFKKGKLPANKYKNIKKITGINKTLDVSWAEFPLELVYTDHEMGYVAGFIENFSDTLENLDNDPLFLGDLYALSGKVLNTRLSSTVDLCLRIVREVCYLNCFGFYLSDYNLGNFALIKNNNRDIQMWDTDSFGYEEYFSGNCDGNKTSRDYNIETPAGAIDFCCDALYIFIFNVLSLGDTPISEYTGKFKYDNPDYHSVKRRLLFPDNLWQHFSNVFHHKEMPSTEALLKQLCVASGQLRSGADKTYGVLLKNIIEPSPEGTEKRTQAAPHRPPVTPPPTPSGTKQPPPSGTKQPPAPAKKQSNLPIILLVVAACVILFAIVFAISYYMDSPSEYDTNTEYMSYSKESSTVGYLETGSGSDDQIIYETLGKNENLSYSENGCSISVSEDPVYINLNSSAEINLSASGNLPKHYTYFIDYHESVLKYELVNSTNDGRISLSLTGLQLYDGYITIHIKDSETQKTVASQKIKVYVV